MPLSRSSPYSSRRSRQRGPHSQTLVAVLIVALAFVAVSFEATNSEDADSDFSINVLHQRIHSIQEYLEDPFQHLQKLSLELEDDDDDDSNDINTKFISYSNDIVQVLDSLQETLKDSEMTRQFYAQGGWPHLASLVSHNVHFHNIDNHINNEQFNNLSEQDLAVMQDTILYIRAKAAMAIGTAIKNTEYMLPWTATTVPLHLVVQALLEVTNVAASCEPSSSDRSICTQRTLGYQEQLADKALYALECFLHGNHEAQAAFATIATMGDDRGDSPVEVLGSQAAQWAQEAAAATTAAAVAKNDMLSGDDHAAPMSTTHAIQMTMLLLSLVNKIFKEQVQVPKFSIVGQDGDDNSKSIIDVMSTDDWCQAAMRAATLLPPSDSKRLVLFSRLQRTGLQAVSTLGRHCMHFYQNGSGQHLLAELKRLRDEQQQVARMIVNANLRSSSTHVKESEKDRLQLLEAAWDAITSAAAATATQ
jgi:hypothetical protein